MAKVTRTINPLHFEVLEPGRFEDLIRQLAHGFRPWRYLEATGKLGKDGGLDIRGVELVTLGLPAGTQEEAILEPQTGVDYVPSAVTEERVWRIQCKRYKEVGPTAMRAIVQEVVPDPTDPPYGIIIAAACNVSADTLSTFHDEWIKRGVQEGHVWSKAHLEDMLFLPENDRLLFAYFGISLVARRRSIVQDIQAALLTKRKIINALKIEDSIFSQEHDILVRNIEDKSYPIPSNGVGELKVPPWHACVLHDFDTNGVRVILWEFPGWVREDKTWDIATDFRLTYGTPRQAYRVPSETSSDNWAKDQTMLDIAQKVPHGEFVRLRESVVLPYSAILEIDPWGDPYYRFPHFYCRFDGDAGPFDPNSALILVYSGEPLHPEMRRPLFKEHLGIEPTQAL